jgi:hypothetical protein
MEFPKPEIFRDALKLELEIFNNIGSFFRLKNSSSSNKLPRFTLKLIRGPLDTELFELSLSCWPHCDTVKPRLVFLLILILIHHGQIHTPSD